MQLREIRRQKFKVYSEALSISWKKKLYKLELQIIDNKIQIEKLKRQYK